MDRKELIERCLGAATTPQEEKRLAESFELTPPQDEREEAVWQSLRAEAYFGASLIGSGQPLPEAAQTAAGQPLPEAAQTAAGQPVSDAAPTEAGQQVSDAAPTGAGQPLPEAGEEFEGIIRRARARRLRGWGYAMGAAAAAVAAVLLLVRKPAQPVEPAASNQIQDITELVRQLEFIANFDPALAEDLEFKPVGDGFVMTARFPDGQSASFMVTPLDGGETINFVALKE